MGEKVNSIRSSKAEQVFYESLSLKYRCMWRIGIETGLRIHDILHIKRHEARAGRWYTYERKTHKRKLCKLSQETMDLCAIYMRAHHVKYKRLLFYSPTRDDHYTRQSVWKMYKDRAIKAKLQCIGAHSSRHTAAWKLYLDTGDIDKVRKFLNHDNIKVTQGYLRNRRPPKSA